MKYNPKFTEQVAALPGFTRLHPVLPQLTGAGGLCQGALEAIHDTERLLCEITGMNAFTLHPMAGAHGELTGRHAHGRLPPRQGQQEDQGHLPGLGPRHQPGQSAAIAGYEVVSVESEERHRGPGRPA